MWRSQPDHGKMGVPALCYRPLAISHDSVFDAHGAEPRKNRPHVPPAAAATARPSGARDGPNPKVDFKPFGMLAECGENHGADRPSGGAVTRTGRPQWT